MLDELRGPIEILVASPLFASVDEFRVFRLVKPVQMYSLKNLVVLEHPYVFLRNERSKQVGSETSMIFGADDKSGIVEQACDDRVLIVAIAVQHRRCLQAVLVVIDQVAERGRIS